MDDEVWMKNAAFRWNRLGGKDWYRAFLTCHKDVISVTKKRRPIERERAIKTQPENVL